MPGVRSPGLCPCSGEGPGALSLLLFLTVSPPAFFPSDLNCELCGVCTTARPWCARCGAVNLPARMSKMSRMEEDSSTAGVSAFHSLQGLGHLYEGMRSAMLDRTGILRRIPECLCEIVVCCNGDNGGGREVRGLDTSH